MASRHWPRRPAFELLDVLPGPLANTLTGRILITTPPGWADDEGNFDPTSGEADVNAPSCRSHSKVARRTYGWAHRCWLASSAPCDPPVSSTMMAWFGGDGLAAASETWRPGSSYAINSVAILSATYAAARYALASAVPPSVPGLMRG